MTHHRPVAAASIVLLCWASLSSAATIGHGASGSGPAPWLAQEQLKAEHDAGSIRSLGGGRGRISASERAASPWPRSHGHGTHAVLTRVCISCLVGVARPQPHARGVVATEREERERLVPSQPRPQAGRRPANARAVPSTQLQASRSGESDLRGASVRQDIPHAAPLLRAPPRARAAARSDVAIVSS